MLLKRWDSHDRNAYAPKFHIRLNLDSNKNWHSKTVYIESWIGVNLFPVVDSQALSMKEKKKKIIFTFYYITSALSQYPILVFGFVILSVFFLNVQDRKTSYITFISVYLLEMKEELVFKVIFF